MSKTNSFPQNISISLELAKEIGLPETIILAHLDSEISSGKGKLNGKLIDGERWIKKTYDELAGELLVFSNRTIRRTVSRLKEEGLLKTAQFDKKSYCSTLSYAIDYDALERLERRISSSPKKGGTK